MMRQTLEYLYCRRHKLKRHQFVRSAYLAACRWYVRPCLRLAILLGWAPVRHDLEIFEDLRGFTSRSQISEFVMRLDRYHREQLPAWRRLLGLRASGRLVLRFSRILY